MTSPWISVLKTNYVPTDDEATQIRAFCEKPQQKVCEIDRELRQLRERLDDLLHERDALVEILESHRALVSPVRRLSPELLQQIFSCCLSADRNPAVHPSEAPLLLGRICRLWREIANSTPQLWPAIHMVIPSNENSSSTLAVRYEALHTWLGRSGVTPLHISLRALLPIEEILPIVNYIIALSTRWASVTLALPMPVILWLCSSVNGSVPILDTVKFDCVDNDMMSPSEFIPNLNGPPETTNDAYVISQFVLRNPSIRHYSLTQQSGQRSRLIRDPIAFLCQESPSSWKLETFILSLPLKIMFAGLQPILDLFSALPHLKRCSLRCYVERGASEIPLRSKPVALHALEELSLGIFDWDDEHSCLLPNLFANLLLPRLSNMKILSAITSDPTRAFTNFTQLLIRSSASLRRLSVQTLYESDAFLALIPVLEASPQLEELAVREQHGWDDSDPWTTYNLASSQSQKLGLGNQVLQVLSTLSASTSLLCPHLGKLSLFLLTGSYPINSFLKSFFMVRRLSPLQCDPLASLCVRYIDGLGSHHDWTELRVPIEYKLTNEVASIVDDLKQDGMIIDMSKPIVRWIDGPYLGLETPNDW